ncbi:quinoprotein amine dehydrogenase, beta chain-like [Actinidia rufa]|uniref:Quinoprotein amine dehydrogenase, beta chain-like n=1 Tax=Actinidia rufa TaxID=165716 RepID=A0A7J0G7W6_9ERIC|nr:quinoprotein amine dehydrogenase, beta chain-like [Actinidia rufa]
MYMAYGWPQVIPLESGLCPASEQIIYLRVTNRLLLVVAPSHLELWSSSQESNHLGCFFATISLLLNEPVPFSDMVSATSNIVCDSKHLLVGLSDGSLYNISWKGEFYGAFGLNFLKHNGNEATKLSYSRDNGLASEGVKGASIPSHYLSQRSAIMQLEFSLPLRLLFVIFLDGQLALCSVSKKGLKQAESIEAEKWLESGDVACASVAAEQQILAVGTRRGVVELYDLAESASLIRSVSLYDWGYSIEDTGAVSCIAWTPDNSAFAVGWKLRGLAVWSVSGCRLMSTIRQIGLSSVSSPVVKPNHDCKYEPMMGGTSLMHWDEYGYRLYAVEERSSERIIAFSFGKCCLNRGVSGSTYTRQVIYGEDRLLIVQSEDTDELKIVHLHLPVSYISQNWPVLHVASSKDGMYLALAGLHGLILYDIRLKKWRVFGDITQEQKIQCKGLLWLGKIVVVCNYIDSFNTYELLFYPRYHLDQSSLLCRKPLLVKPMVMDVHEDYLLVTYHPFDVHIFHVKLSGELTPSSTPDLQLSTVRVLSIMTAKSHPAAMRFIPDPLPRENLSTNHISTPDLLGTEPVRCLILRANGELSLLDLDDGRERELTDSVELFWVTCGQSEKKTNLIEEVSWLDYGHRGMQVWYPSSGVDRFKQEDFLQLDPELEFDREVYPLGLLPNAGVVVGVCQRMSFSACTEFPCFEPSPQSQTILHCLLRHLLQRDKSEEALRLAILSAEKPHFSHCLEWLLFTVFDAEISRQSANKNQISVPKSATNCFLLEKTCDLIKNFPEYFDVVVSVARKTDGRHWADLFSAAGRSTELFEECFHRRWYRTAACYILVIAKLEGPAVSQILCFTFITGILKLRRQRLTNLYMNLLGSCSSTSFKEQNAHVASVKNILESHASYLMSGKELSKLVAFVKGTQFDLVEYLQRERYGSACLDNFASGLELIGQKLQMGTLQSRLDAEFLLAHMCSVKFKEWIVVLATLLRRSEVLFDLFQHDMRLWKAYSVTLQSQPAFAEYQDLLESLEEQLSSTPSLEEK